MAFIYYNANPLKNHVLDCTIRSISLAQNKSYRQTFRELSEFALQRGLMMDSVENIEQFLDARYRRVCYNENITVEEFAEKHPEGRFLVTMRNHISCIINSDIIDTWDCSEMKLKCAWLVPNKKR